MSHESGVYSAVSQESGVYSALSQESGVHSTVSQESGVYSAVTHVLPPPSCQVNDQSWLIQSLELCPIIPKVIIGEIFLLRVYFF